MRFWGAIRVPDDEGLLSDLMKFLAEAGEQGLVRIGTGRTRGLGMVTFGAKFVERDEDEGYDPYTEFKKRLFCFNKLVHDQAKDELKLEDPRLDRFMAAPPLRTKVRTDRQRWVVIPAQAGKLVLFESWLRHEVPPNPSAASRVSVSFNYNWF